METHRSFSAEQLQGKSLELLAAANPAPLVSEVINEFLAFYQGWKVIKRNNQVAFTLIPVTENSNIHKSLQMFSLEFKSNIAKFVVPTPYFLTWSMI